MPWLWLGFMGMRYDLAFSLYTCKTEEAVHGDEACLSNVLILLSDVHQVIT